MCSGAYWTYNLLLFVRVVSNTIGLTTSNTDKIRNFNTFIHSDYYVKTK